MHTFLQLTLILSRGHELNDNPHEFPALLNIMNQEVFYDDPSVYRPTRITKPRLIEQERWIAQAQHKAEYIRAVAAAAEGPELSQNSETFKKSSVERSNT